ncbi:hypothetical protein [Fusobacterium varium]|uniref:hypothetical protein n=1 Tax=Fusobacterium varium TaxID=856 RepID=UPI00356AEBED
MPRKSIPTQTKINILTKSKRRCAYCFGLHGDLKVKHGQIAHIDRNNENNSENNLAFLCLEHHNVYDSTFKQTINLFPQELINYKTQLENYIAKNTSLLDNSSINPNGTIFNPHDFEMFCGIKEFFFDNNALNKIINFNFGVPYHINHFDIEENLGITDIINIWELDINYYFRDEILEKNRILLFGSIKSAMYQITDKYFFDSRTQFMNFNSYNDKYTEATQYIEYCLVIRDSFFNLQNRAIELGYTF